MINSTTIRTGPVIETNARLVSARDTFIDAQRALEDARNALLHAHAEAARRRSDAIRSS